MKLKYVPTPDVPIIAKTSPGRAKPVKSRRTNEDDSSDVFSLQHRLNFEVRLSIYKCDHERVYDGKSDFALSFIFLK